MRLWRFEPAPLLIGFVLGPMIEEYFRRAMLLSRGDPMVFLERSGSATLLLISLALLVLAGLRPKELIKRIFKSA